MVPEATGDTALLTALRDNTPEVAADPALDAITHCLLERYGESLQSIVLYGSYLRGKRDTLLDCYALLDGAPVAAMKPWHRLLQRVLPPNVYYLSRTELGVDAHAKVATVDALQLAQAIRNDSHSYFWSRFAQPCATIFARDENSADNVERLRTEALSRCLQESERLAPLDQDPLARWQLLFQHTYQAELRSESPERAAELVQTHAPYYRALSSAWAGSRSTDATSPGESAAAASLIAGWSVERQWRWRRWIGKCLSLLRLMKAAFTFSDGLDYLLWKVERHSGVALTATDRQRRHPLLFAWPLVWRAYRAGGFR